MELILADGLEDASGGDESLHSLTLRPVESRQVGREFLAWELRVG